MSERNTLGTSIMHEEIIWWHDFQRQEIQPTYHATFYKLSINYVSWFWRSCVVVCRLYEVNTIFAYVELL